MAASGMLSINITSFADPSQYQLSTLPRPVVSEPTDVLIKVHAASINPIDVKKASGIFKALFKEECVTSFHSNIWFQAHQVNGFPYKIGHDCAGVVVEIGPAVSGFKVEDEVYSRLPERSRGSWSEYAICAESLVAHKPKSLSFGDAASLPLAAITTLQAPRKYRGSLVGKTIFITGGLSGTGAYACQLAKNVFHAGKVITTVSTAKVAQVPQLLGEGVVDQIIDYTKEDVKTIIPRGSVDFMLDTTGQAMEFLSLMTPKTSTLISIATHPSGDQLQQSSMMDRPDNPRLPLLIRLALNAMDSIKRFRAWRWSVEYEYLFLDSSGAELAELATYVEEGKVRPVVGSRVNLRDIDKVREACSVVFKGKGGIGKTVIDIIV